jgi:hypothetical protein
LKLRKKRFDRIIKVQVVEAEVSPQPGKRLSEVQLPTIIILHARAIGFFGTGFRYQPQGFETGFRSKKSRSYLRAHSTENSASARG